MLHDIMYDVKANWPNNCKIVRLSALYQPVARPSKGVLNHFVNPGPRSQKNIMYPKKLKILKRLRNPTPD